MLKSAHVGTLGALCAAAFRLFSATADAQDGAARVEQARFRANDVRLRPIEEADRRQSEASRELIPTTPGNTDIGLQLILKRNEALRPFRLFADAAGYYTNTVGLASHAKQGDAYVLASFGASYERKLTPALSLEITVRESLFRYDAFNQLNFESLNAGAGLSYEIQKLWGIALFGRYNFERLTNHDLSEEFFHNHTLTAGLQKTFAFGSGHFLYAGYSSVFGFADPVPAERDEHGLFAGLHVDLGHKFTGDLYYRAALFDYAGNRNDFNQTVNASLAWNLTKWASVNASASFTVDRSNHSSFNYDVLNTGGGISLRIRF